jgi:Domain of unknown function (DUF4394)
MCNRSPRRGIRALALALLTLTALAAVGCGKDGGGGLTEPGPGNPGPGDPGEPVTPTGPAPVGEVMYAVDLANNFLVFGSGSTGAPTAVMRIEGLPILKRVIGLAIRPSDGALIGVGNDSRVYTIDPLTAEATPVSSSPFSPAIVSFFDNHFAMALEPNGQRVRLIAAESGANWSIDIHTGTATDDGTALYGPGSELEGQTPRLLGIVYPTLPDSAKGPGWCENLAYGVDADEAMMIASCDPATGLWWPTGRTADASVRASSGLASAGSPEAILRDLQDQLMRCGEFMASPEGSHSDGEPRPQENGPWFPRSPDTPFYVFLVELGTAMNRPGVVTPISAEDFGINWMDPLPTVDPVQSAVFAPGGPYGPSQRGMGAARFGSELRMSAAKGAGTSAKVAAPAGPRDPRAECTTGSAR